MVSNGKGSPNSAEQAPDEFTDDVLAWIPQPGDNLKGHITYIALGGVAKRDGGFGLYPILEIQVIQGTRDGEELKPDQTVNVHAFHSTLQSGLRRMNAQPGDRVSIVYAGQKTEGGRFEKGFHLYRVRPLDPKPFHWGPAESMESDDDEE
jgi:hypothetical protein